MLTLHRHAHCSAIIATIVLHVYSSTLIAGHLLSRLRYKRDSGYKPSNRHCPDNIGTVGQSGGLTGVTHSAGGGGGNPGVTHGFEHNSLSDWKPTHIHLIQTMQHGTVSRGIN